jgi:thymidylate synthase ThyX
MNFSTLIPIAILVVAFVLIKLLPKLIVRQVARVALSAVGEHAMAKVPEQIQLARVDSPQWKNEAAMQQQSAALVRAGFNDLGAYSVDKMPGVLMRILFQPQTYVSAQICEHPKAGGWTEFATRYADGGSDFLTTLPDQGIAPPPFVRTSRADKNTPTDRLYQQHLKLRKASGIKPVSQNDVIHEFEDAYMRYMIWKNNKGLKAEEVAQVALKWAKAKQQAAGQS